MGELLAAYYAADHLGTGLGVLAVAAIFATVKHAERVRPVRKAPRG